MSRSRRTLRSFTPHQSGFAWTEEIKDELLAWAEHCRKRDGTGKYFEETIARHLLNSFGAKLSDAQIDEKIRELAQKAKKPLSSIHHSYLYKSYGLDSTISCVITDRAARKVLQCRIDELNNNESSKPSVLTTPPTRGKNRPVSTLRDTTKQDSSNLTKRTRREKLISRKYRGKKKQRSKASKFYVH